jgi:hypothetical protein
MAGGPGPFSGQAGAPIDMDIGCIGELSPRLPPRAFSWIWPLPFSPTPAIAPPRYVFRDGRHPSVDAPSTLVCAQELAARFLVTKGTPAGSTQAAPKLGARAKRAPFLRALPKDALHRPSSKPPAPVHVVQHTAHVAASTARSRRGLAEGELPRQG